MICPKCGKEANAGRKFCIICGTRLNQVNSDNNINANNFKETTNVVDRKNMASKSPMKYLIIVVIVIVIIAAIIALAYVITGISETNSNAASNNDVDFTYQTTTEAEETTDYTTEETTRDYTAEENITAEEQTNIDYNNMVKSETIKPKTDSSALTNDEKIYNLMNNFYGYAWVQTTNNHDPSYVAKFTIPDSPAYNVFGLQYWQEKSNIRFNSIYNINILKIDEKADKSCDVYVYYTFDAYNANTGNTYSEIELAVDNVILENGTFLLNDHSWKKDLPLGTTITLSDF